MPIVLMACLAGVGQERDLLPADVAHELVRVVIAPVLLHADRMSHQHHLLHLDGPLGHQRFQDRGQPAAVVGDAQPGVVAQVDRREAQLLRAAARRSHGALPARRAADAPIE
jgi:hypothetical protein